MKGKVLRIISGHNYGFIQGDNGGEYFFHHEDFNGFWADLERDLGDGKEIEVYFNSERTDKGMRARRVSRLDFPNQAAISIE